MHPCKTGQRDKQIISRRHSVGIQSTGSRHDWNAVRLHGNLWRWEGGSGNGPFLRGPPADKCPTSVSDLGLEPDSIQTGATQRMAYSRAEAETERQRLRRRLKAEPETETIAGEPKAESKAESESESEAEAETKCGPRRCKDARMQGCKDARMQGCKQSSPAEKKRKICSCGSQKIAWGRALQFPGSMEARSQEMWCILCGQRIDHKEKSAAVSKHLKERNKLNK